MARSKKDGRYVNFYMSSDVFEMLEKFSEVSGLTKTMIMERAVRHYIDAQKHVFGVSVSDAQKKDPDVEIV